MDYRACAVEDLPVIPAEQRIAIQKGNADEKRGLARYKLSRVFRPANAATARARRFN
jgi:hypothetical protein